MMRRLCVTNVPLHVRKEEFSSIFRPLDGCVECRLVNQDNRPVGFVTFATEQQARNAQEAYNLWQGFGQGGLLIELISTEPGGPRAAPMPHQAALEHPPFQGLPVKRPLPEALDTPMHGPGGYKQMRPANSQMDYGGAPRLDAGHPQQQSPQERFMPPRYEPLDRAPAAFGAPGVGSGPGPAPGPAAHSRAQYDEPFPAAALNLGSYAAPAASRFPEPQGIGGGPPVDRVSGAPIGMSHSVTVPGAERPAPCQGFPPAGYDDRLAPQQQHLQQAPTMAAYAPEPRVDGGSSYGPQPVAAHPHLAPEPAGGARQYGAAVQYAGGYPEGQPPPYQAAPQQQGPPQHHDAPLPAYFDRGPGPQEPEYVPPGSEYAAATSYDPAGGHAATELPHDARSSLYVETVPQNATRREVAHIFRPFPGYKEVRLVEKPSKINAGETLVHAFVEFTDAHSATEALNTLQGYLMDPTEEGSPALRIKYATDRHFGRPAAAAPGRGGGRGPEFGRGSGGRAGRSGGGRSHEQGGRGEDRRGDGARGRGHNYGGRANDRQGDGGRGRGRRKRFY